MDVQVKEVVKDVPLVVHLRPREMEVLLFMSKGVLIKEIARLMGIGIRTVRIHQEGLYIKLGAANHCEAVANAFRLGILT